MALRKWATNALIWPHIPGAFGPEQNEGQQSQDKQALEGEVKHTVLYYLRLGDAVAAMGAKTYFPGVFLVALRANGTPGPGWKHCWEEFPSWPWVPVRRGLLKLLMALPMLSPIPAGAGSEQQQGDQQDQ